MLDAAGNPWLLASRFSDLLNESSPGETSRGLLARAQARRRTYWCRALLLLALFVQAAPAHAQRDAALTTTRQVHQLTAEQAAARLPVRLHGVVTFCDEPQGQLFVQDESGGIFVEIHGDYGFPLRTGQELEIAGVSAAGGFAPDIEPQHIRLLGEKPLPAARLVTFDQMALGQEDCNWVEFNGIVRAVEADPFSAVGLKLAGGAGRVMVPIQESNPQRCRALVDAEVGVRGVCIAHFNRKGQLIQVAVQISSMDDIAVRKPASADPFAAPLRKISHLMQYAPVEEHSHRVRVKGTVTLQRPGESLVIADETQGLYVQTTQATPVQSGELVEVVGFAEAGQYVAPILQDGEFRKVGVVSPLLPIKIAGADGRRDTNHAALVQIEARVLNRVDRQRDELLELQSGATVFDAQLDRRPGRPPWLATIPVGSRVLITGVCLVPETENWLSPGPRSFSLLLRSEADVTVLQRPSWWDVRHTLWVLAGTLAVFGASLAWVAVLRRQVRAQTKIIAQKIQHEAALEERARIARDLHDELGASLTHISFLSEVARKEQPAPSLVAEHLSEISDSTRQAFESLDEIVWVVNPKNDTVDSLTSQICHFATHFFHDTALRCRFDLPASLTDRPVPTEIRNHLFLAVKEALNNVRKHAGASEVSLRIRVEEPPPDAPAGSAFAWFSVGIEDNGTGFQPGSVSPTRNGLTNMRQRLATVGGRFSLESQPSRGTVVRLSVPLGRGSTVPALDR